jgi:hypothetical protein
MISSCSVPDKEKGLTARTPEEQSSGGALIVRMIHFDMAI